MEVTHSVAKIDGHTEESIIRVAHEMTVEVPISKKCRSTLITSPEFKAYRNFYIRLIVRSDGSSAVILGIKNNPETVPLASYTISATLFIDGINHGEGTNFVNTQRFKENTYIREWRLMGIMFADSDKESVTIRIEVTEMINAVIFAVAAAGPLRKKIKTEK